MTISDDYGLVDCDEELSQQQLNDLLMNWALLSMDENPSSSLSLNNDGALNQKARND